MHTTILAPLLLGLGLMLAVAAPAAADDRQRHGNHARGNDHSVRHSTPSSRHEAIKRRHLRMFDKPRVVERRYSERRDYEHDRYQPRPRYYESRHGYAPHRYEYRGYQQRRHQSGVVIGTPAIRININ